MTPTSRLIALGPLAALSACLIFGGCASEDKSQAAPPTQWKWVSRMVNGTSVRYRVPVDQNVPNDMNLRPFVPDEPAAKPSAGSAATAPTPAPRSPEPPPLLPTPGANDDYLPWARPPGGAAGNEPPKQVAQAAAAADAVPPQPTSVSQEAETALGKAEIAVRDAQARFETAQAALKRAREASQRGDSTATIKFANTASSLAQPTH